ncbi:hypothetical protein [Actinacidiphila sp. ITFR-21]|uniref:hypothetical protein n=1 Tax=Actinacidiphila sp. ITFR-21 TaxID=3075199 RepID=UPI00288ADBB3|nr:hypothetical protein [Streptomyces sp. ITFR-21]WNI19155.1 hypothetical protein RLT57_28870 [Streptomyces sp. ITFR-21]
MVVAIIGGIASSCGGGSKGTDGQDAADIPTSSSVADVGLSDTAAAVRDWYSQNGDSQITAISADLTTISGSAGDVDFSGMLSNCISLQSDVADAQAAAPIPDDATQGHWATALDDFSNAAADCITGTSAYDSDLIARSGQELDAGGTELTLAAARVGELADN